MNSRELRARAGGGIFDVKLDGKLVVAGKRGPWGFAPALEQTEKWLAEYKKTGKEPAPPAPEPHAPQRAVGRAPRTSRCLAAGAGRGNPPRGFFGGKNLVS